MVLGKFLSNEFLAWNYCIKNYNLLFSRVPFLLTKYIYPTDARYNNSTEIDKNGYLCLIFTFLVYKKSGLLKYDILNIEHVRKFRIKSNKVITKKIVF